MALLISLGMIVLITVAVMAFFSYATSNRRIEASRANRVKAELLTHSGVAHVTGTLLSEIASSQRSGIDTQNGVTIYTPLTPADSLPARTLAEDIDPADPRFFNLIRQSVPDADSLASTHSSAEKARNGRMLNPKRWDAPVLVAPNSSGAGFSKDAELPHWIYVDRRNGLSATPTADTIGRFAYNVYDVGGLFNANVAGYPSGLSPEAREHLVGGQQSADLSKLLVKAVSGMTAVEAQAAVDQLASFRNPDYPAPLAPDGVAERSAGAASKGFLSVFNKNPVTDAAFVQSMFNTRQDLIHYAKTQNTDFEKVLPYLTHFSRSLNAPSWKPPISSTYVYTNPQIPNIRSTVGGMVTHYDDEGGTSEYPVGAGDPLVQRRFSLAKLAWLTPEGPSAGLATTHQQYHAGGTAAAIQACFGLNWSATEERWDYVGASGSSALGSIKTLAEVAAETVPREPNFFEYLKAGILDGSLGSAAKNRIPNSANIKNLMSLCKEDSAVLDANKDLHVLRIGANIIDCADSDNYPTILALGWGGIAVEKAGVEDLPYFYAMDMANLRTITQEGASSSSYRFNSSDYVWVPELLNPHRVSTSGSGPDALRIEVMSGFLRNAGFGENGWLSNLKFRGSPDKDLAMLPPINIASGTWETFRNAPGPVRDSAAPNRLEAMVPGATDTDALAFHFFSHGNPADYPGIWPGLMSDALSKMAIVQLDSLVISLRYRTPANNWKTYVTLGGHEAFPEDSGIDGYYRDDFEFRVIKNSDSINNGKTIMNVYSPACFPPDPRSSRFGPVYGRYKHPLAHAPQFKTYSNVSPSWNYPVGGPAFFYPASYQMNFTGNFPQKPGYEDPDNDPALGPRPPDGNIGFSGSGSTATAANPYKSLANHDARPIILQRPYRSVAELGYVFRDMPWQTLNFYNTRSADAALLDLFAVRDQPAVTAGAVALTTRQQPVMKVLFAGIAQEGNGTLPLSDVQSDAVSAALESHGFVAGMPSSELPVNVADLAEFLAGSGVAGVGLSPIKYRREAVVRALSATQTRTWNMVVDVVAQAGRFPGKSYGAADFVVAGESRLWNSFAIDRYTGKIIGRQKEKVHE